MHRPRPAPSVLPVHRSSLPPPVVCMCYPRLPPRAATTRPRLCSSLGIVGLVTLVHRGGRQGPRQYMGVALQCTGVGGITLRSHITLQGVSEAPLTWSNPGKSSSCWRCPPQSHSAGGAWLQGCAGMGGQEGTQAPYGALRGCSTAFLGLSGRGSVTR